MKDEELRLECLKIAFESWRPSGGFGTAIWEYNRRVPENATLLANQYFNYLKTGIAIKVEEEKEIPQ